MIFGPVAEHYGQEVEFAFWAETLGVDVDVEEGEFISVGGVENCDAVGEGFCALDCVDDLYVQGQIFHFWW